MPVRKLRFWRSCTEILDGCKRGIWNRMFYDCVKVENTFHGNKVQTLSFTISCRVQREWSANSIADLATVLFISYPLFWGAQLSERCHMEIKRSHQWQYYVTRSVTTYLPLAKYSSIQTASSSHTSYQWSTFTCDMEQYLYMSLQF
jgi:hypothetical protein